MYLSTIKMIQNYNYNSREAYSEMCKLVKLCNVDVINMNDKRGKGIQDRVLERWPEGFNDANDFNNKLRGLRLDRNDDQNYLALVF